MDTAQSKPTTVWKGVLWQVHGGVIMKDGQFFPHLFYLIYVFTMSTYYFYNGGKT